MALSPQCSLPSLCTGSIGLGSGVMALWTVPLLLLFHFGAGLSYPPTPTNVSITSVDMDHTLRFLPGSRTLSDTHFRVEVKKIRRKSSWKPATRCSSLGSGGQTCNLTDLMKNQWDRYQARVQAYSPDGSASDWAMTGLFLPLKNSVLGPPNVFAEGCGNCLVLQVRPSARAWKVLEHYRHLQLLVRRTRDGAQFHWSVNYKQETVISHLEPSVEYCVTVTVVAFINQKLASAKTCAFTSPPRGNGSVHLILALLGVLSLLGMVLIGLLVHARIAGHSLLRSGPLPARTKDTLIVRL